MSESISITLPDDSPAYEPRAELVGTLTWRRAKPFTKIQLHLFWYTTGVGDDDSSVVETLEWENPGSEGERFFQIRLPRAPYSIKSENLEIHWRLEATGDPGKDRAEVDLVIAPGARRVELKAIDDSSGAIKKLKEWMGVGQNTE